MGVDYYKCDGCGRGYRDDSEYACFCNCGSMFCSEQCGKLENYAVLEEQDEGDPRYQDWIDGNCQIDKDKPITCCICRKESYNEQVLLYALLQHYGITKEQAVEIYKKQKD